MKQSTKEIAICFVGDSGDGIQLIGEQFTYNALTKGWAVQTLPDFPAEIRAPAGTQSGVSGYQVTMANEHTLYDGAEQYDVLVAMNPAALIKGLPELKLGGLVILNEDNFSPRDLKKAGAASESEIGQLLKNYIVHRFNITSQTIDAIKEIDLTNTQAKKTKNFYVLGMVLWLFELNIEPTLAFIEQKFAQKPAFKAANQAALKAGLAFALTMELPRYFADSPPFAEREKESKHAYRHITGINALTLALACLSQKTQIPMLVSGYPITPASNILHESASLGEFGISVFQAEDEIAAICSAIGGAYTGKIAVTCTSGPGMDLKSEGLGLAVMTELPLIVIDVQRAGPSTGLPTKTEQADLNLALYGRHGEAPLPVIAANSPQDCFDATLEAYRLAITYMTPVVLLLDAHVANGAGRWLVPDVDKLSITKPKYNQSNQPFKRDKNLARSWIIPGSQSHIYQLGGLEKEGETGEVSYDADNHQQMVNLRKQKIDNIKVHEAYIHLGKKKGPVLLISWGSTYGAVRQALETLNETNYPVAMLHLRALHPLPQELSSIIDKYQQIIVAELNQGQLLHLIRSEYLVDAKGMNQCNGRPFKSSQIINEVKRYL